MTATVTYGQPRRPDPEQKPAAPEPLPPKPSARHAAAQPDTTNALPFELDPLAPKPSPLPLHYYGRPDQQPYYGKTFGPEATPEQLAQARARASEQRRKDGARQPLVRPTREAEEGDFRLNVAGLPCLATPTPLRTTLPGNEDWKLVIYNERTGAPLRPEDIGGSQGLLETNRRLEKQGYAISYVQLEDGRGLQLVDMTEATGVRQRPPQR